MFIFFDRLTECGFGVEHIFIGIRISLKPFSGIGFTYQLNGIGGGLQPIDESDEDDELFCIGINKELEGVLN